MSAELLRRAAQQMRELAEGATPGPWQAHQGDDPNATAQVDQLRANHLVCDVERCAEHPGKAGPDAAYIASWHPATAIAVADWLELVAGWTEEGLGTAPEIEETNYPDAWSDVASYALSVARAYLGEDTP